MLPRLSHGDQLFDGIDSTNRLRLAAVNFSVFGFVMKLRELGISVSPRAADTLTWVFTASLGILVWRAARHGLTGLRLTQVCLAALVLAATRRPFVPSAYGALGALWLIALLAAEDDSWRRWSLCLAGLIVLAYVIPDRHPGFPPPRVRLGIGLVQQLAVFGVATKSEAGDGNRPRLGAHSRVDESDRRRQRSWVALRIEAPESDRSGWPFAPGSTRPSPTPRDRTTIVAMAIVGSCALTPYNCDSTNRPSTERGWQAYREPDREQHQHFPHHQPDHETRLSAERESDAELLSTTRDHECHHAVEPDRREQRGEEAEPGRQRGDEVVGEQRLVELRFDGLHLVDRHALRRAGAPTLRIVLYADEEALCVRT